MTLQFVIKYSLQLNSWREDLWISVSQSFCLLRYLSICLCIHLFVHFWYLYFILFLRPPMASPCYSAVNDANHWQNSHYRYTTQNCGHGQGDHDRRSRYVALHFRHFSLPVALGSDLQGIASVMWSETYALLAITWRTSPCNNCCWSVTADKFNTGCWIYIINIAIVLYYRLICFFQSTRQITFWKCTLLLCFSTREKEW